MINLDDLERRVQEGYSIPPFGEGKELVMFLRVVEEKIQGVDWERSKEWFLALDDIATAWDEAFVE